MPSPTAESQNQPRRRPRGRWAPSPSGLLHLGSARTALVAWLSIRAAEGTFVWRLEDLDPPRVVPGAATAAMQDLAWLGLDWDEGCRPEGGEAGAFGPYAQSRRGDLYRQALDHLAEAGRLFPCRRTRKDLQDLARAPHGGGEGPPYPDSLRLRDLPPGWWRDPVWTADAALRFRVLPGEVIFDDLLFGEQRERPEHSVGHFVLRRRDGLFAYQLAVVVDDLAMEIDEVVRGADLLASTARQIQLAEALAWSSHKLRGERSKGAVDPTMGPGAGRRRTVCPSRTRNRTRTPETRCLASVQPKAGEKSRLGGAAFLGAEAPRFGHVPLVLNENGEKLSKRDQAVTLRSLREAGCEGRQVVGYLAATLGLLAEPRRCHPRELVADFEWRRLPQRDHSLPQDPAAAIRGIA